MPEVYFSSSTNSTFFTTCCQVAICDDQANCPVCKREISPRSHKGRWDMAMANQLGGHNKLKKLRQSSKRS